MSRCHICAQIATVFTWRTTCGGFQLGRSTAAGGAQSVEKFCGRAPNRLLVVQPGGSANQAKVFEAHAVPQSVCENLINAHELLANPQKDGDNPSQSIVTGLCERGRKGIMEGLRNFIEVDNHSASDVGYLKEGTRSFVVRRPKFEEGSPEVSIREGPKELTLRTEEVSSPTACIKAITFRRTGGDRLWLMLIGMPSAGRSTKIKKEETARNCTNTAKK